MRALLSLLLVGCQTVAEHVVVDRPAPPMAEPIVEVPTIPEGPKCTEPEIVLGDGAVWNDQDDAVLAGAKRGCGLRYKNSPCVKKFTKLGGPKDTRYRVVCGVEQK